ncbi:MAG: hypothetical protein KIT73_19135, partial [Burkholderiales bacterium]|nr:hypothetical protein [Burkholderiales bacterium]
VTWDEASESIIIDLSLADTFGTLDVPLDFSIDLGDFADITSDSSVRLTGDGALNLKLGIYLGNEGGVALTNGTPLSSLKDGAITFNKDLVIAAPNDVKVVYGQLSDDAKFKLAVNGGADVEVIVLQSTTTTNQTVNDLVADINAALATAGLASQVQAVKDATTNRVVLNALGGVTSLVLTAQNGTPTVLGMGFSASQTAASVEGGPLRIRASGEVAGLVGRLSGSAAFQVTMNTVNGGSPVDVIIPKIDTDPNRNILDIVVDVQKAIDDAVVGGVNVLRDQIVVGSQGRKLLFTAKTPGTTSFSITAAAGSPTVTELGLAASNTGSGADIIITSRNGTRYAVSFDALGNDATLGDVINAIKAQTSNTIDVQYIDDNTRLRLIDNTGSGTGVFKIENAIGSFAANLLGILGADVNDPDDPDEVKDFRFDSGPLGGVDLLDRLFIQEASAEASFSVDTPTGLSLGANFGFVGVSLEGDAELEGSVKIALKDPDQTAPDGRITLKELFESLGDIGNLIDPPEITGGGQLELGVNLEPSFGLIETGNEPTVLVQLLNLGDIFDTRPDSVALGAGIRVNDTTFTVSGDRRDDLQRGSDLTLAVGAASHATKIDALSYDAGTDRTTITVFDAIPAGTITGVTAVTALAPSVRVTTSGFEDLANFDDIGFADILAGLRGLVDFLNQFEEFGFLNEKIPLINVSVNDMLAYADEFAAALDQVESNPAATVQFLEQKLKEAFNIPATSDLLVLKLVRDGATNILRFDLTFKPGFSESLPIGFELPTAGFELSGGA